MAIDLSFAKESVKEVDDGQAGKTKWTSILPPLPCDAYYAYLRQP